MKFLHIADLHLGKKLNDADFLPVQEKALDQVVEEALTRHVDAVVIAGDVYQQSSPPAEAMKLFDAFVSRLTENGCKVIMISGNHDSGDRISYLGRLVKKAGLYASETFDGVIPHVTLSDEYGDVNFYLLPFLRYLPARKVFPGKEISSCEDAVREAIAQTPIDPAARNVLVCHQFVLGAEESDSEEKTVGGLDKIPATLFKDFDYTALGHIHKPQYAGAANVRYAGSLYKYSFSETAHRKSMTLVEMGEKGKVAVSEIPFTYPRDVRRVEGYLDELLSETPSEDYVWVTLHDEEVPIEARYTLRCVFPNMLKFSVVNSKSAADMDVTGAEKVEQRPVEELFREFYKKHNNDRDPGEMEMQILLDTLREIEEEGK